jgi:hypothetical protein
VKQLSMKQIQSMAENARKASRNNSTPAFMRAEAPAANQSTDRRRQFGPARAQRNANRTLHSCVSSLSIEGARHALLLYADVHSIVDGWTLAERIQQHLRNLGPVPDDRWGTSIVNYRKQKEHIDDMAALLNEHGASIPPHGF